MCGGGILQWSVGCLQPQLDLWAASVQHQGKPLYRGQYDKQSSCAAYLPILGSKWAEISHPQPTPEAVGNDIITLPPLTFRYSTLHRVPLAPGSLLLLMLVSRVAAGVRAPQFLRLGLPSYGILHHYN